ncbi:CopG family transcriptional regulator [Mycolicibacter longobardus]|uniref:Antitoxin n=1 Tax=Mycolicibacter longobardus TaxID=1108812 RepID=A0A1X1YAU9_9MYCO|nr:CopG family transcriptional regulator [Mycolicibacter longobardus]ORW08196.1 antitoxin [Mycolicibacter longobardus]
MRRTNIYLDEEQTASLDLLAKQEGVSRAELIRRFVDRALAGANPTVNADVSAIEQSFGILVDLEAPERGPGERQRHLTRIWDRQR